MYAFTEIGILLALAATAGLLMQRLRLPLILGYIATGIVAGPAVLGMFHAEETFDALARLGITALLFIVGIGLSPKVARDVGKSAVIAGLGQIAVTTVLGFGLGLALHLDARSALFLSVAFAFSSTIIVSKVLSDKKDLGALYGRLAVGILLVQDVVVTVVLVLMTAWTSGGGTAEILALVPKAIGLGFLLWAVSRHAFPRLSHTFAQSQEFLLLFSIGWGCGLAVLFNALGLSMEIGALVAGMTLATSPYQYEISSKMRILRDFFLVLFFILLGSQLTFGHASSLLPTAGAYTAFILIGNPLVVMTFLGMLGYGKKTGFLAGLTVAQVSEFSLLLVLIGVRSGHANADMLTLAAIVALATIAGSTVLMANADAVYRRLSPALGLFERRKVKRERRTKERFDALLFGCHRVGSDFLTTLGHIGGKYLVVDFDPDVVKRLTHKGIPVRYGDAEDNEFLDDLDLEHVKTVVSTLPDIEVNLFVLGKTRRKNKKALFIATAQGVEEANELYAHGADYVVLPHYLGGNHAALLLDRFGHDPANFAAERAKHVAYLATRRDA